MFDPYSDHPPEEALEGFLLNRLTEAELEIVETHILACESCVEQLETLELLIAAAKTVTLQPRATQRYARFANALKPAHQAESAPPVSLGTRQVPSAPLVAALSASRELPIRAKSTESAPPLTMPLDGMPMHGSGGLSQNSPAFSKGTVQVRLVSPAVPVVRDILRNWRKQFSFFRLSLASAFGAFAIGTVLISVPREVSLSAYRGGETPIVATWRPLRLTLNARGLTEGPVVVEMVDNSGSSVWQGSSAIQNDEVKVTLPRITTPGPRFVRLYNPSQSDARSELLREFTFQVK